MCPGHIAPFEAFADAYFNRDGSIALWHGSRGLSGKSYMLSALGLTKAFLLGADTNILGGSLAQSANVHEAMRNALDSQNAPRYMLETESQTLIKLSNKAKIRPLTASQKTVRGPHPPFLLLDEIDEMDEDILNAALGQPMPQMNYLGVENEPYTVLCIAAGTEITVKSGNKAIEDVRAGDEVWTREGWKPVLQHIDNGYRETVEVTLSHGKTLICTPDHPIATPDGWMSPQAMSLGQQVLHADVNSMVESSQFRAMALVGSCASATVTTSGVVGGVVRGELVTPDAVGLEAVVLGGRAASAEVLVWRDRFKMFRADARWLFAQMIDLMSLRDRSNKACMRPAMDVLFGDKATIHHGIAAKGLTAIPDPTLINDGAAGQEPLTVVGLNFGMTRHVYDLSVADCHEFVANGVIVHNCSTWQNADGTFAHKKREFEEKNLPIRTWCYRESMNPVDGWLSEKTVENKRREIPAEMWRVEYELGEPSIGNRAFDSDAVEKTFDNPFNPLERKESKDFEEFTFAHYTPQASYIAGADWAKEQDFTVITVIRVDKHPYEMVYWLRLKRRPYPIMIGMFNDAIAKYNARAIHDSTGLGNVVSDYLDTRAQGFTMTGEKRSKMLSEYVSGVERGDFKLPKIPTNYLAHKYARYGDLYENNKDYHLPDEVCAMALANHHARKNGFAAPPGLVPKDGSPNKFEKVFEAHKHEDTVYSFEGGVQVKTPDTDGINLLV